MPIIKSLALVVVFITMITHPEIVSSSTLFAMNTWWKAVVPALLPFFITAELLIGLGIMDCLSVWLEPVMRPIFRLPGCAALAVVMGFVSGSPTGANITASLREKGLCTKNEAQRLVAFTNNASPLYILVAVSVGILQSPQLGIWLFLSHYPINLLFGILLRFFDKNPQKKQQRLSTAHILKKGVCAIRGCNCPPVGKLLSNCVKKSLINIGVVGGFMVIFSLLSAVLEQLHILQLMAALFLPVCKLFGLEPALSQALASGFWEMTIGIAKMPETNASILSQAIAASIMLAWNGVSIQAQVASMLNHTDVKLNYYIPLRALHSLVAPLVLLLATPYISTMSGTMTASGFALYTGPVFLLCFAVLLLALLTIGSLLLCRQYT